MGERLKVLLILALTVIAVVGYAVMPQQISFNGFVVRKLDLSGLHDVVPFVDGQHNTDEAKAGIGPVDRQKEGFVNGVDTTHQTVLFFGDSMTGGICHRLDDYCQANGHKLYTITWYSSTTEKFAKSNILDTYIRLYHPTYLIVCLGSNELFVHDVPARRQYVNEIIKKFGGKPFVWVSPPNWKRDTGIDNLIKSCVGDGRFFDSSRLKLERASDHIHPTTSGSAKWTDEIARWLGDPDGSAHPIRMEQPDVHYYSSYDIYTPQFDGFSGSDNPVRHRHFGRR